MDPCALVDGDVQSGPVIEDIDVVQGAVKTIDTLERRKRLCVCPVEVRPLREVAAERTVPGTILGPPRGTVRFSAGRKFLAVGIKASMNCRRTAKYLSGRS